MPPPQRCTFMDAGFFGFYVDERGAPVDVPWAWRTHVERRVGDDVQRNAECGDASPLGGAEGEAGRPPWSAVLSAEGRGARREEARRESHETSPSPGARKARGTKMPSRQPTNMPTASAHMG